MKRIIIAFSAVLLGAFSANAQTTVQIDVEATRVSVTAGPYAKYARELLGLDVCLESLDVLTINSIKLAAEPVTEGVKPAVYTNEVSVVDPSFDDIPLTKEIISANTTELKAKAAAAEILKIRTTRDNILTGNTDASYTGEALGAAMAELSRLENLYLKLFAGYTATEKISRSFVVSLAPAANSYIVFRSTEDGRIVGPTYPSGKPYFLKVSAQPVEAPQPATEAEIAAMGKKQQLVEKNYPAKCTLVLADSMNTLLTTNAVIPEYGKTVKVIVNK